MRAAAGTIATPKENALVTVNGVEILESELMAEVEKRIETEIARAARKGLKFEESSRGTWRASKRDGVLDSMIGRLLIMQQLKKDNIEITDAEVEGRYAEMLKTHGQTIEEAELELREEGRTVKDALNWIRWNTLGIEKLHALHAKDKKDMTEAEARSIYVDSPAAFEVKEERRVSHILVRVLPEASPATKKAAHAKAEDLRRRATSGENFAQLARAYSEDDATKDSGGDRGYSTRGFVTSPDSDPFGNAAFALKKVGDVSDVVESQDGFHIIKLTGRKEARKKTFEEAKVQIIGDYHHHMIGEFWDQFSEELRKQAKIDWSPAELARREEKRKLENAER